jgi:hypothetical protein
MSKETESGKQVRIPPELLERVEAHRRVLVSKIGVEVSLTRLVASLLSKGLEVSEMGK